MDKGKNQVQEQEYAYVGTCWVVPENSKPVTNTYELSSRYNDVDKSTGNYSRYTVKEQATFNERHVERGSRREGVRDEYKVSETVKVGNKSGYTEYHTEQRVRDVTFDDHITNNSYQGGEKYVTDGGLGGGCSDIDYSHGSGGGYEDDRCDDDDDDDDDDGDGDDDDGDDYDDDDDADDD